MLATFRASAAVIIGTVLAAGCAGGLGDLGGGTTTSSINEPPRIDPACVTLTAQIDGLNKDGVADRVAKAAVKKHKMTPADLAKADQLNKANAEFQARCATTSPRAAQAPTAAPAAGLPPAAGVGQTARTASVAPGVDILEGSQGN